MPVMARWPVVESAVLDNVMVDPVTPWFGVCTDHCASTASNNAALKAVANSARENAWACTMADHSIT